MATEKSFVHLHVHTDFSMLDGMETVDEVAKFVAADGQPAAAITDHGNMSGYIKFEKACDKAGVSPIPGIEAYHVDSFERVSSQQDKSRDHMILLGVDGDGYRNLMEMSSRAYLEQFYYKPLFDDALIEKHTKGVVMTSGCIGSPIGQALLRDDTKTARELLGKYRDMLDPGNYFVEVQAHDFPDQRHVNELLLPLAKDMGLPLLATQDAHYASKEKAKVHEWMLAMQTGAVLSNPNRFKFASHSNYLATAREMREMFPEDQFPGACDNTLLVAEMASGIGRQLGSKYLIPSFPDAAEFGGEQAMLRAKVLEGARAKYGDNYGSDVAERIEYELGVIHEMGFDAYFLIVWDMVRWAKENGIYVGPGRGSAAGAITAYALDITTIDPIRYGLYFERFLNPGRKSMPDIDIDFERDRRAEVREYVRNKYGYDFVSYIATQGRFHGRSAIKASARIHELPVTEANALSATFPKMTKLTIKQMLDDRDDLPFTGASDADDALKRAWDEGREFRQAASRKELDDVLYGAEEAEGYIQGFSKHAAGLLITPEPLYRYVPLTREPKDKDDLATSGYDKDDVEGIGGLKMDLLGLINLTTIRQCVEQVEDNHGVRLDVNALPLDDKKTFALLQRADTDGVFQLGGDGMKELLRRVVPTTVEDLSAVLALYRPGPMGTEMHYDYADRKNGRQRVTVEHPDMLKFTKDTYGVLCVAGDTQVIDANTGRSARIDSIQESVEAGEFFTVAIDDRGVPVKRRVTNWYETGVKEVFTVTTKDGRKVRMSADHPVLTTRGWTKAGDLIPGVDRLARPALPLPSVEGGATISEARLIGYLIGDGQITLDANKITSGDQEAIDDFISCAQDIYPDIYPYYERHHGDGGKACATVSLRLNEQGIGGGKGIRGRASHPINTEYLPSMGYDEPTTSESKHVPERIFESSNEVIAHFLAALWDCDGHICTGHAHSTSLKTISRDLAFGVAELLSRLGIHSTVLGGGTYESVRSDEPRVAYGVHVHSREFEQVASKMTTLVRRGGWGVGSSRQQLTRRVSGDSILTSEELSLAIAKSDAVAAWYSDAIESGARSPSWRTRSEYLQREAVGGSSTRLKRAADGSVRINAAVEHFVTEFGSDDDVRASRQHWIEIESITSDGDEVVYDITVDGDHNFLGNGFVLHNCYQEQMLALAQQMAGFTAAEADTLRKATGKKDAALLATQEPKFKNGMIARGYDKRLADTLWKKLPSFAEYSFNAAHSMAYAMVSYQTAYLKANYPAEYAAACVDTLDDPALQMQWAKAHGVVFEVPDVNEGSHGARAVAGKVRLGLSGIKGLGDVASAAILNERRDGGAYESLSDFLMRLVGTKVTRPAIEALVEAGALDSLITSRGEVLSALADMLARARTAKPKGVDGWDDDDGLLGGIDAPDVVLDAGLTGEETLPLSKRIGRQVDRLGVFLGVHPMSLFREHLFDRIPSDSREVAADLELGDTTVHGVLTAITVKETRRSVITIVTLESESGHSLDAKIFGAAPDITSAGLGSLIMVDGVLQEDEWRKAASQDPDDESEDADAPRELIVESWVTVPLAALDSIGTPRANDEHNVIIKVDDATPEALERVAERLLGQLSPGLRLVTVSTPDDDAVLPELVAETAEEIADLFAELDFVSVDRG